MAKGAEDQAAGLEQGPAPSQVDEGRPARVISASGYLGQFVTIVPATRIVAVRQRRSGPNVDPKQMESYFGDFSNMVEALVPSPAPSARKD